MKRYIAAVFFVCALAVMEARAAYLENIPVTLSQPDGTYLSCYASGDEYCNYYHDLDGRVLLQDETGWYVYAALENGKVEPSEVKAGEVQLFSQMEFATGDQVTSAAQSNKNEMEETGLSKGVIENIVLFIRFADEEEFVTPELKQETDFLFNTSQQSMQAYFSQVSEGALTVRTNLVGGDLVCSYQDSHPRAYYEPYHAVTNPQGYTNGQQMARERELVENALAYGKDYVEANFTADQIDENGDGAVDNVCFVVSGEVAAWSNLLWPHMTSMVMDTTWQGKTIKSYNFQLEQYLFTQQQGSGVLVHEFMHTLGFPDMYRAQGSLHPVGLWSVMANHGTWPQYPTVYEREQYGCWEPQVVEIEKDGTYTLQKSTATQGVLAYRIPHPKRVNEYFMVEYRKRGGNWENTFSADGLLVYRVNEAARNGLDGNLNGPPDELYVFRKGADTQEQDGLLYYPTAMDAESYGTSQQSESYVADSVHFSNGQGSGIVFSDIKVEGDSLTFTVTGVPQWRSMKGSGSKFDPYRITNEWELQLVRRNLDAYYRLECDIDLLEAFAPIGTEDAPFTGHFDGNGKTVSGIKIMESSEDSGFFGVIGKEGVVKNLKLQLAAAVVSSWDGDCGAFAAENHGRIIQCASSGGQVVGYGNYHNAGGLVGKNSGTLLRCSSIDVDMASADPAYIFGNTGGLVGSNTGMIRDCYSTNSVVSGRYAGGVAAVNAGTMANCYSSGEITASQCGGLVYRNEKGATIENCYFTGTTSSRAGLGVYNAGWAENCYYTNGTGGFLRLEAGGSSAGVLRVEAVNQEQRQALNFNESVWKDNGTLKEEILAYVEADFERTTAALNVQISNVDYDQGTVWILLKEMDIYGAVVDIFLRQVEPSESEPVQTQSFPLNRSAYAQVYIWDGENLYPLKNTTLIQ